MKPLRSDFSLYSPPPKVVYHYTSLSAMMSILKTQTMWASDIGYLNDVSERKLMLDLVDEALPAFAFSRNMDATPFSMPSTDHVSVGPFVASFSADKDSLYQWRSYCPIANGVSIGFKTECLERAYLEWKPVFEGQEKSVFGYIPPCQFREVSYIEPHKPGLGEWVLANAYAQAEDGANEAEDSDAEMEYEIEPYFRSFVETSASFYKHGGFVSEEEYRLLLPSVFQQFHQMEFRCTRSSMVPYVGLRIPHSASAEVIREGVFRWDAVSEIVIGPTPNIELTQSAVWQFLRSIGLASSGVTISEIPYRDW